MGYAQKEQILVEEKLQGTVRRVVFKNDATGYCVLSLDGGKLGAFTATGSAMFSADPSGMAFIFKGAWSAHPRFGRQFVFSSCEPEGGDLYYFLAKVVKGLGEVLAKEVIQHFGEHTAHIIETAPEKLLDVKGIGKKRLEKVVASWHKYGPLRQLSALLVPCGVSTGTIVHIFNCFGDQAYHRVKSNPYSLTEIPGVGFKRADKIAMAMGIPADSVDRIRECVKYVLSRQADDSGDTIMPEKDLLTTVLDETSGDDGQYTVSTGQAIAVVSDMKNVGDLAVHPGGLALKVFHKIETKIKGLLEDRLAMPPMPLMSPDELAAAICGIERDMGITLSQEQRMAVELAARGERTIVVCGYAGTGKTTVSRVILELFARVHGREQIACMALSGVAADRVRKVSGFKGNTIHTTLGFANGEFVHGPHNPLPYKVVLLDESSMVNSWLFMKVISALGRDTVFVMLGDPAQLPPIGAGDPFNDIIENGLCLVAKLTRIYRQKADSVLVEFANEIRKGVVPQGYQAGGYADFRFTDMSVPGWFQLRNRCTKQQLDEIKNQNEDEIVKFIQSECLRIMESSSDLDVLNDFQVLSPMRKGALGTENLNRVIQQTVNPRNNRLAEMERLGVTFRELDKVIHLQNKDMQVVSLDDYMAGDAGGFPETRRAFNGSVGQIVRVDRENEEVHVMYPSLNLVVCYDYLQMKDIVDLAWCLTVHKSQGNEYGECIIPVTTGAFIMMTNKLLYTAMTRAKRRASLVGQAYMFEKACKTLDEKKRKTVLQELCQVAVA